MKRRMVAGFLAVSLAAGMIAGCGAGSGQGNQAAGNTENQAAGSKDETLKVTMALGEDEWKVMREKIIPEFEEANGVKVEAIQMEAADVVKQLKAMSQAGNVDIDVIAQDANNLTTLVYEGLVEDLSEYTDMIPEESIGSLSEAGMFDGKT